MAPKKQPIDDRARKTLYVTGFNSKVKKHLLKELFSQGGPVTDITMFDTHAYVLFQHEESVPYCLALFNEVELFGEKLKLNPRYRSEETLGYMRYLSEVRNRLRDEYAQIKPPILPPKKYPCDKQIRDKRHRKSNDGQPPRRASSNFSHSFDTGTVKTRKRSSSKNKSTNSSNSYQRKQKKRGGKRRGKPRKIQKLVKHLS